MMPERRQGGTAGPFAAARGLALWLPAVWLLCVGNDLAAAEHGSPQLRVMDSGATVTVLQGDQPILRYRHQQVPYKPYVAEFFSRRGVNVLRDAPHDHLHHHGLMFAVSACGVDFWIEAADRAPGRQVETELQCRGGATADGTPSATILQRLKWVAATGEALLSEDRSIEIDLPQNEPVQLLTWRTCLQPAEGKGLVRLGGEHYFGLGMRFVESMDRVGRFISSSGDRGHIVRGEERLLRAGWCAYTAPAGGEEVTVALFDHPRNPRHPATMFTMTNDFAYLSATLNLWKRPLWLGTADPEQYGPTVDPEEQGEPSVRPGGAMQVVPTLKLSYGVALWDGAVSASKIDRLYRRWTALASIEQEAGPVPGGE